MLEAQSKQEVPSSTFISGVQKNNVYVSEPTVLKEKKGLGGKPHGQRILKSQQNQDYASQDIIEDSDGDETSIPGPGSYSLKSCFQSSSIARPKQSQRFGSSVERFQYQERAVSACAHLGPGIYTIEA